MAQIGRTAAGGCSRLALTREDYQGRALFLSWCRPLGFGISTDAIGNLFVIRPGINDDSPVVLTGSHLDTQPNGGMYDGVYGVLAGLEVLQTLEEHAIRTQAPIGVAVWTNEEGSRLHHPVLGSSVFAGTQALNNVRRLISKAAASLHLPSLPIRSGTGHDAYPLGIRVPADMIFIPCKDGLSHHLNEDVSGPHLQADCQVLLESLVEFSNPIPRES